VIAAFFLLQWFALALGLAASDALFDGFQVDGGAGVFLGISLVFAVLNLVLGTIARIITIRLIVLSLGLFSVVINAAVLLLTDAMIGSFEIDGFWTAFWSALLISILAALATLLFAVVIDRRVRATAAV
jgi:putative membrane protein